jgi:hypothetical protein
MFDNQLIVFIMSTVRPAPGVELGGDGTAAVAYN